MRHFSLLHFQFLLPLIIEKMDSDVQSAKLDSLQTLVRTGSKDSSFIMQEWWWGYGAVLKLSLRQAYIGFSLSFMVLVPGTAAP